MELSFCIIISLHSGISMELHDDKRQIELVWIRGHRGIAENENID